MPTLVLAHIVEQHAEDAAMLWLLRDRAVDAPHMNLESLAQLDDRLEAHIDGLRVAGEAGWEIALAAVQQYREPGEAFVAAVLALESRAGDKVAAALAAAAVAPATLRAVFAALGWVGAARLRGTAPLLLGDPDPLRRLLGVAACSVHGVDAGAQLPALLRDDVPAVRARALRLVGELGRADLRPQMRLAYGDSDVACAFWAAWSGALVGDRDAPRESLRRHSKGDDPFKAPAHQVLLRILAHEDAVRWLRLLRDDPAHARLVVSGAGILGDPAFVPWLIERMADPVLARLAGESVALITGADLVDDKLEAAAPAGWEAGPSDSALEDDVALDEDADLPWPDPERLLAWWGREGGRMPKRRRHLLGRPIAPESCEAAWTQGFQRQRRAAAFELALARPDAPLRNWRAPVRPQRGS